MAYHLESGETVPEGIRRVIREEIESAAGQLAGKGDPNCDEAIHEARKSVKKIRGALRLMRPGLGDIFHVENVRFRNLGRKLSEFRDAGAIIETLDALEAKYRGDLGAPALASIRRGLLARKQQSETQANAGQVLKRIAAALGRADKRAKAWPLAGEGFAAIAQGLERTFQGGRKAMAAVRKDPRPENYHEWRKRAKDHWYHVRLLESLWTDEMRAREKSLKELETWLGQDHNLVVLREKVLAEPAFYGGDRDIRFFLRLMNRYHRELRRKALSAGRRIYQEKPRRFTRRVERLWDAWQAQPGPAAADGKTRGTAIRRVRPRGGPMPSR